MRFDWMVPQLWRFQPAVSNWQGSGQTRFIAAAGLVDNQGIFCFEHALIRRAKAEIVEAALTSGLVPAHSLSLDLKDTDRVHSDAARGMSSGFLRMWRIYPAQIQPITDTMMPDFAKMQTAAQVLLAARQAGWAPVQYEDGLQEATTCRYLGIRRTRFTGVAIPEEAVAAFY